MARIRTIKPEFCTSEQIAECSPNARLLFVLMWCFCDDGGVHPDSAKRLKMECFPADDIISADVSAWVDELVAAGLLKRYAVDNQGFLAVTGWSKHQKIDQPTYKFPQPDGTIPTKGRRNLVERSANDSGDVGERSPPEGKGMESKGKEKESPPPPPRPEPESDDDGNWVDRLGGVERVLVVVWRQSGATEDQIQKWLTSTRGQGRDKAGEWLKLCPDIDALVAKIGGLFDDAEARGGGIGQPWPYLDKAIKGWAADRERAEAAQDWGPPESPWPGRIDGFVKRGFWVGPWGPRPGDSSCLAPPDLLRKHGFLDRPNGGNA